MWLSFARVYSVVFFLGRRLFIAFLYTRVRTWWLQLYAWCAMLRAPLSPSWDSHHFILDYTYYIYTYIYKYIHMKCVYICDEVWVCGFQFVRAVATCHCDFYRCTIEISVRQNVEWAAVAKTSFISLCLCFVACSLYIYIQIYNKCCNRP